MTSGTPQSTFPGASPGTLEIKPSRRISIYFLSAKMTVKLSAIAEIAGNHCAAVDKCPVSGERGKKSLWGGKDDGEEEVEEVRRCKKDAKAQIRRRSRRLVDRGSESEIAYGETPGEVYDPRYPLCALIKPRGTLRRHICEGISKL